jgi:hypothetical protein
MRRRALWTDRCYGFKVPFAERRDSLQPLADPVVVFRSFARGGNAAWRAELIALNSHFGRVPADEPARSWQKRRCSGECVPLRPAMLSRWA